MKREELRASLRFKSFIVLTLLFLAGIPAASAQDLSNLDKPEDVAESVIAVYSLLRGREGMDQIRKTTVEQGNISIKNADGTSNKAKYERYIIRGENLEKERNRYEQLFPNAKIALVYDGEKIFGLLGNTVFTPKEESAKAFRQQIWHGLDALLRYKENESKVELVKKDKVFGVDYYILDVTDKQNRTTRFYISQKTLRIMMLEYEADGVNYKRKFYDYNYAQNTLVPYRTVLWADDKIVEESEILTITFGQKVEDFMFEAK